MPIYSFHRIRTLNPSLYFTVYWAQVYIGCTLRPNLSEKVLILPDVQLNTFHCLFHLGHNECI